MKAFGLLLGLGLGLSGWVSRTALARAAGHIVVDGPKREVVRPRRAGQGLVIRPEQESRFDFKSQLKGEASIALPDTGRQTASGFALPRVRGQDARVTEIYLDGQRLQDPYAGFPIVDDLDLRAVGEMAIFLGVPPPDLPTVTPNGVLAYRVRPGMESGVKLGSVYGKPYGLALWGLASAASSGEDLAKGGGLHDLKVYAREHWTRGDFSYYDDNATPYNAADDRFSMRRHADRHARQLLPRWSFDYGNHQWTALGLYNQAQTSLPARMSGVFSDAREYSEQRLGRLAWDYNLLGKNPLLPKVTTLEAAAHQDAISLDDPTNAVLGIVQKSGRQLASQGVAAAAQWEACTDLHASELWLRAENRETSITAGQGARREFTVERRQATLYAGADVLWQERLKVEVKHQVARFDDQWDVAAGASPELGVEPDKHQQRVLKGNTLSLAWLWHKLTLYGQVAKLERPATLLEEFGDGGLVRDNAKLRPEITLHRELGWSHTWAAGSGRSLNVRQAVFVDTTLDRIVMLPSIGQTMRAQNASKTRIDGLELGLDGRYQHSSINISYAKLRPYDLSVPQRQRLIAGVAREVASLGLGQEFGPYTLRWQSRYQTQVWRDLENTIAVPAYTIHDASLDAEVGALAASLAVINIGNLQRAEIKARGTDANRGYTSYGDFSGMPLPGRQWRLSVTYTL